MPALKRNSYYFLSVSVTDLGERLQQQRTEFYFFVGRGLGDTCLSSLSKGFLLIRPLSLFHTVDATNDFPAIPANSCQAHKLRFSSIQYLGVFLANTELPLLAQCHVGDLLQVVFTGN